MENIIRYVENYLHKKIYIAEEGCNLINRVQGMITRERIVARDGRNILIPGCQIFLLNDDKINALVTQINDEYCIFVNRGLIEEQKKYLENMNWQWISDDIQKGMYINRIIEYGFFFMVFHEYAHIFCGHNEASLTDSADKKAEECEADMFSMSYLVRYILNYEKVKDVVDELVKLFLAVYFLFEKMQEQNEGEYYNNKLIQNYYDYERAEKRTHPLDAQRILYLYEMMNIMYVKDYNQAISVKEVILGQLKQVKGLVDVEIPERERDYKIVEDSIEELKSTIQNIREKIPRIGNDIEESEMQILQ